MTDDERAQIAMDHLQVGPYEYDFKPYTDLIPLYRRDVNTMKRAVITAFRDGLVHVVRAPPRIKPVESLEEQLRRYFPALSGIRVIDCGSPPDSAPAVAARATVASYSDTVHATLGRAVAQDLGRGLLITPGARVGCGSGRAVYFVMANLASQPPLRWRSPTILSLNGNVGARGFAGEVAFRMDADFNANSLSARVEGPASQRRSCRPSCTTSRQRSPS